MGKKKGRGRGKDSRRGEEEGKRWYFRTVLPGNNRKTVEGRGGEPESLGGRESSGKE